ncbi:MAG: cyclic nucleotide-binding domain-containing protein [Actinomycetota bacterium]|jgi:CRP-like cAMP-binding protein|nr:cyclic nucleotide-binding domain-containing protein [Actinomycetota bacterium]
MTRRNEYLEHLARVPLFSACSKMELKNLARRTNDIKVDAGQVIIRENQGAYDFFVVFEGQAEVTREGRRRAVIGPGDFFGELALLDRGLRDATVTALTPMEIIVLPQWDFEQALDEAPRMTRKLLTGMARRLRALDERG